LKQYPPEAKAIAIREYLERYQLVRSVGMEHIDLSGISSSVIDSLSALARRYDVRALKRFPQAKGYAMVACFLVDARKTILDHIVEIHDQLVTAKFREAGHAFEERHRQLRRRNRKGLDLLIATGKALLDPSRPRQTPIAAVLQEIDENELQEAVTLCAELRYLETRGHTDELHARYPGLRRYLPGFFQLPFQGEPGSEPLLVALDLIRQLDAGQLKELPENPPIQFVPPTFRSALLDQDGFIDRRTWELALAVSVRDALRSGDLYLPESRRHVSFWNLAYDEQRWLERRDQAYDELALPLEADHVIAQLNREFDETVHSLERGLSENHFVKLCRGRLQPKHDPSPGVPAHVQELQDAIEANFRRIRIEDLLIEVDSKCQFTQEFKSLEASPTKIKNFYATLLAALIAHGTNLGLAAMGNSAVGISTDALHHLSQWFLHEQTLKAANAALVNYHHELDLSPVWGQGLVSSSDGQRFKIQASSLLGSFYPRYFGYYDRAVSVHTHISDQYSVFSTRVISCSAREAIYVLDGLLENDTVLRPREHYTDTHGYTEQLFGLCYLLGYSFMPRIRDLKDQQLYKLDRQARFGQLDSIFRSSIEPDLIREQWDQLVRVAASLRHRTAPAHVVLKRLAGGAPSDRLAKALTALGRIVKTIHLLRYLQHEELRRRVQLQLNRGESRHRLARWLFFAKQGAFQTGDYTEIMNKASCLSLLSNAVLVWNTMEISRIIEKMQARGESIAQADLARISPLAHAHVIPSGTYFFDRALSQNI
jgi:TnpA family transposase